MKCASRGNYKVTSGNMFTSDRVYVSSRKRVSASA